MKKLLPILFFTLSVLSIPKVDAQHNPQDSLRQLLSTPSLHDTTRAYILLNLSFTYQYTNPDSGKILVEEALALFSEFNALRGVNDCYFELFLYYYYQGDLDNAQKINLKSKEVVKELFGEESKELAKIYNRIASVYRNQGAYEKALKLHLQALEIAERNQYISLKQNCYNFLGILYNDQDEHQKALEYYFKSLEINQAQKDQLGISTDCNNIGLAYSSLGEYEKSLEYHLKCLAIQEKENVKEDLPYSYINIGELFASQGKATEGLDYVRKGLPLAIESKNKHMQVRGYVVLGWCQRLLNNFPEAIKNGKKGVELAEGYRIREHAFALEKLYQTYEAANQLNLAYPTLKAYHAIQDSIVNDENRKKAFALEAQYAFEKEKQQIEFDKAKERVAFEASLKQERLIIYGMSAGIVLLMGLLVFAYRTYRIKQKANSKLRSMNVEISRQHQELLQQTQVIKSAHKKITTSINYAKRIQTAILPTFTQVNELLPQSFILHKPKDVVSGDFYWIESKDDKVLFAVADCTGHGVPGAIVSIICHNALNRSLREHQLIDPAKILDKTRELLLSEFSKSQEKVPDGMDIALCVLEENTLHFSGAYNPLWLVRDKELIEFKGNRQPIGKFKKPQPFTLQSLELQKDDSIYIFSDGFIDQFGGSENRKFKSKQLKELLIKVQDLPMNDQKQVLENTFNEWKGTYKQIDDVCLLGVKV